MEFLGVVNLSNQPADTPAAEPSADAATNRKKMLDLIAASEGGEYDLIVGGKQRISDYAKHPNVVGLTTPDGPSTAAGRYQITRTTWNDIASDLPDFSPASQDEAAIRLLKRRGALEDVDRGDFQAAIAKLGDEWVSLPSSTNKNQPRRSQEFIDAKLGNGGKKAGPGPQIDPSMVWGNPDQAATAPAQEPQAAPQETSLARRLVADPIITALKGAISVPEAAVGVADIFTGGHAGKFLEENLGFKPKQAKEILSDWYSEAQKTANKKVEDAEGFAGTASAMLENPSTIGHGIIESGALMGGGATVARGLLAAGFKNATIAAAIGEGVVGAGSAAEQIRQETKNGLMTAKQSGAAAASGAGTFLFGFVGGKMAQKLGIADIDTVLASGATKATTKGFMRRLAEGGISEGVFEEMPQSAQEQMWQNFALDKPIMQGVDKASAAGLVVGAAQGGPTSALFSGDGKEQAAPGGVKKAATNPLFDTPAASGVAPTAAPAFPGAVEKPAAETNIPPAQASQAAPAESGIAETPAPGQGETAQGAVPEAAPAADAVIPASEAAPEAEAPKAKATQGQIAGWARKRALSLMEVEERTPEQEDEYEFLTKNVGNADVIAQAYGIEKVDSIAKATGNMTNTAFKGQAQLKALAELPAAQAAPAVEPEHQAQIDWLNKKAPEANFVPFVEPAGVPDDDLGKKNRLMAVKLGELFGKPVRFFDHKDSGPDAFRIDGVLTPNGILIDANSQKPHTYIFGHELTHNLRREAPDVYNYLVQEIAPMADLEGYTQAWRAKNTDSAAATMNDDQVTEEFMSDLVGRRMHERQFWAEMAKRNPTRFQRVAQAVTQFIDGVITRIKGDPDAYLKNAAQDLGAVRSIIADAMAEYHKRLTADQQAQLESLAPAEREAVEVMADAYAANPEAMDAAVEEAETLEELTAAATEIVDANQTEDLGEPGQSDSEGPTGAADQDQAGHAERADNAESKGSAEPTQEVTWDTEDERSLAFLAEALHEIDDNTLLELINEETNQGSAESSAGQDSGAAAAGAADQGGAAPQPGRAGVRTEKLTGTAPAGGKFTQLVRDRAAKKAAEPVAVDPAEAAKKQIPDMTDAEVLALKDHYAPDHKRHAKIAKEIEKRGLNNPTSAAMPEEVPAEQRNAETPVPGKDETAKQDATQEGKADNPEAAPQAVIAYEGKGGKVFNEEALQRRALADYRSGKKIDTQGGMSAEYDNMFTEAFGKQAEASFDADGKYIGEHKYRFVAKRSGGGIYMFDDLAEATEFADTYGQRENTEPAEKRKRVGKGDRSQTIFENEQGIRSYRESGFKYVEEPGKPRADNFKTVEELAAEQKPRDESDQDRSHREWRENYDRVSITDDLSTVSTKDLERADAYADRVRTNELRKGWTGGQVNKNLADALQAEQDRIEAELKKRRAAAEQKPQPATKKQSNEVTSETARRGEYTLKSGETARIVENATRGVFSVSVGKNGNFESYGRFQMDDQGAVSRIEGRANWATDAVREAAMQFALEHRPNNEPQPAPADVAPAPVKEETPAVDTGDDIPLAFYKKVKVDHDVWIQDENKYETVQVGADQALASVREDITNLRALLQCMKG
jgi:muramidase (phage lysozyme)